MPLKSAPQTWRLVEPCMPSANPCPARGQIHRYLMMRIPVGDRMPVLFRPGVASPRNAGMEVELHVVVPTDRPAGATERSRYEQVAERVYQTSIRCEGCGARFEEVGAYRVHDCAVVYR